MQKLPEFKKPIYVNSKTVLGIVLVFFSLSCTTPLSLILMLAAGISLFSLGIYSCKAGKEQSKTITTVLKVLTIFFFIISFVVTPNFKENFDALSKENILDTVEQNTSTTTSEEALTEGTTKATIEETTLSETSTTNTTTTQVSQTYTLDNIPEYTNSPYFVINGNNPSFTKSELTTEGYEVYSNLDSLGRCGVATASIGKETMPKKGEERGKISSIKPTGWKQNKYDFVDGGWLYNRSHLIGWQLSAENANKKNLITGTRYMNTEGMLPFENMVDDYIEETNNHVAYRITPIFKDNNLLASGVQMEAYSIEDNGKGVKFNVYCYNVQPGVTIDYKTGANY